MSPTSRDRQAPHGHTELRLHRQRRLLPVRVVPVDLSPYPAGEAPAKEVQQCHTLRTIRPALSRSALCTCRAGDSPPPRAGAGRWLPGRESVLHPAELRVTGTLSPRATESSHQKKIQTLLIHISFRFFQEFQLHYNLMGRHRVRGLSSIEASVCDGDSRGREADAEGTLTRKLVESLKWSVFGAGDYFKCLLVRIHRILHLKWIHFHYM